MDVSVIIPLYNGERFLASTLDSILAQTLAPVDVVVVDDGSRDGGAAIAAGYGDRVRLLSLGQNSGVQAARNIGIAAARGDWIAFCDQDDVWSRDYLAAADRLIRSAPGIDLVFTNFRMLRDDVPDTRTKFDQAPDGWWDAAGRQVTPDGWTFSPSIAGLTFSWQPIFPSGLLVARQLVDAAGGFDLAMRGLRPEDWEFTIRCLYRARAGALPDPRVTIRRHEENFSRDIVMMNADEVTALQFIKQNHPEAAPFAAIIDREIAKRRIMAVEGAFAQRNHVLARKLLADVASGDRSLRLSVKGLCLALPDVLGMPFNRFLQRISAESRSDGGVRTTRWWLGPDWSIGCGRAKRRTQATILAKEDVRRNRPQ